MLAHVLPMNGSELRTQLRPEAVAAVFVGGSTATALDITSDETKDYLRRRFGLTVAEANVALEIVQGDGREAVADRLGISMTTVRTNFCSHSNQNKTGTRVGRINAPNCLPSAIRVLVQKPKPVTACVCAPTLMAMFDSHSKHTPQVWKNTITSAASGNFHQMPCARDPSSSASNNGRP